MKKLNGLKITSGKVAPPNTPEGLEGATTSHQPKEPHLHVQSDSSSRMSAKYVMRYKSNAKAQPEAEAWRPSYAESREPSV